MAQVTIKEMLSCGVHFGHQTHRWNPKMKNYVFGTRSGIHIIDLQKSVLMAQKAADFVKTVSAQGGKMVFVGTKKQASTVVKEAAEKCGQYYITKRWLGGTLTNFVTIKASIDRLKKLELMKEKGEFQYFSKKEQSRMDKEQEKLTEYLEGIKDMKDLPKAIFIVDLKKEHIAVHEAKVLGIPVVGISDTNADPDVIQYPIPGNDDAIRSIQLFANLIADSYLEGAKLYQDKIRSSTDKGDEAQGTATKKDSKAEAAAKAAAARKLVAVGTADDVEIAAELEQAETETTTDEETN
ncbi:MAG: 30S ribosomal protein S2 [Bdellovibrionota bacterium]